MYVFIDRFTVYKALAMFEVRRLFSANFQYISTPITLHTRVAEEIGPVHYPGL